MDELTILQAEILKTLASPRRLEILHALARGPIEVGRLAEAIGATQPNVSQHLGVLRAAGIVEAARIMRDERVHRLVVVNDRDAPIGVLSATDFVRLIADG